MPENFAALLGAYVLVFGLLVFTVRYAFSGYEEARRQGTNPLVNALWRATVGFVLGLVFVWIVLSAGELFLGSKIRYLICTLFEKEEYCSATYGGES